MKVIASIALMLSICTYIGQIIFFTNTIELLVYAAAGIAWYAYVIFGNHRRSKLWLIPNNLILAIIAGIGLGIVPPRLRLEGQLDAFLFFFPVLHFLTTYLYLSSSAVQMRRG